MSLFERALAADECAVVVHRSRDPELIRGPGSVRTFNRWKQVTVVDLAPFPIDVLEEDVAASDGEAVTVRGSAEGQVADPVAAATRVVDYREAARLIVQTAIRSAVKERPASGLRRQRAEVEAAVGEAVTRAVRDWGLVVSSLRLELPSGTRRD